MKRSVKHLRFPKTAIEIAAKFRQIAGQMLGADTKADTPHVPLTPVEIAVDARAGGNPHMRAARDLLEGKGLGTGSSSH
jgi:hypothetical protein